MKFKYFFVLSILILATVNFTLSQNKKNTELHSLKEQVELLEDKNSQLETKISIADNKIELLTKQIQLLEEQNELLKNNINLLNNNLNNSTPKDDGRRYTIKFHAKMHNKFYDLKNFVTSRNISYFEYDDDELSRVYQDEYGNCRTSYGLATMCIGIYGEIGIFKNIDEAITMKSKLPKGINYEIIQINPK